MNGQMQPQAVASPTENLPAWMKDRLKEIETGLDTLLANMPESRLEVQRLAAERGLVTLRQDFHGRDYARTLESWHRRFVESGNKVRALGFDERFMRMWRYYFSYCRAGFRTGRIDLMQTLLCKPADGGKEKS